MASRQNHQDRGDRPAIAVHAATSAGAGLAAAPTREPSDGTAVPVPVPAKERGALNDGAARANPSVAALMNRYAQAGRSDTGPKPDAKGSARAGDDAPVAVNTVAVAPTREQVHTALRGRRVRALDMLLVAVGHSKRMGFARASSHCASKKVAGLGNWRLPTIGELISLSKAKMVDSRFLLWSDTMADTWGDSRLTWSGRRRKIGTASLRYKGARTVCVQTRMDITPSKTR
jgi:hypothetical protein